MRIRETWGQQRVLKSFTFADSNGTGDWRLGKLWKANRYHYISTDTKALIFADGFESGDTSAWALEESKTFGTRGDYTVRWPPRLIRSSMKRNLEGKPKAGQRFTINRAEKNRPTRTSNQSSFLDRSTTRKMV